MSNVEHMVKVVDKMRPDIASNFIGNNDSPFNKYNIIYGGNGSGKTTLGRMLNNISANQDCFIVSKNVVQRNIKIFSKDYIDRNLYYAELDAGKSSDINRVLYMDENHIQLINQIDKAKSIISRIGKRISDKESDKKKISKKYTLGNLPWLANKIKDSTGCIGKNYFSDYRQNTLERDINRWSTIIEDLSRNNNNEINMHVNDLMEKAKKNFSKKISELNPLKNNLENILPVATHNTLNKQLLDVRELLGQAIIPKKTIASFLNNTDYNSWAEQGMGLHKSGDSCIFCNNAITVKRWEELIQHFNKSHEELKKKLKQAKENIVDIIPADVTKILHDKNLFLSELQENYQVNKDGILLAIGKYNLFNKELRNAIEEKQKNMFSSIPCEIKEIDINFSEMIKSIELIVGDHNDIVKNFEKNRDKSLTTIAQHQIVADNWYASYCVIISRIKRLEYFKNIFDEAIINMNTMVEKHNKSVVSLNYRLQDCFQTDQLQFTLNEGKTGYLIERDGEPARDLSEGEKNMIALKYFFVSIHDINLKKHKLCVVLDDPVTSFDDENFDHVLSSIEHELFNKDKPVGQVIIMTHNFLFFRKTLRFTHISGVNKKTLNHYKISKNRENRSIQLLRLNDNSCKGMIKYVANFKKIYQIHTCKLPSDDSLRLILNPTRQLVESFYDFCYPGAETNPSNKLKSILRNAYQDNSLIVEKSIRYAKLLNGGSHMDDNDQLGTDKSIGNIKPMIKDIMDAISKDWEEHYKYMVKLCEEPDGAVCADKND